ncbi:hypothetical protein JIN84_08415 [Luteolibacter yonseiensis]|uniref:Uncharacterized protein n=1 Tax=Luteolibacter yonseiensis TaxID=1144680 RepID=A0A934R281_9BACT|nr:hypothetical protein [Luteolibacter yonseiensis]MBK1815636.1 hypothetical protein [Luteolibacter yonseiensis]
MNFRTVSHLLKTDWQRFNIPIIGMWVCFVISAAPWLTHDPASFGVPMITGTSYSGNLESLGLSEIPNVPQYLRWFGVLALVLPVLLSTFIGMHDLRWQSVSPIRPWQRLVAKTLGLLFFIVLPQLVPGVVIAMRNGFSPAHAMDQVSGTGTQLLFLYGTLAVIGRYCGSFWSWSAAVACFIGVSHLIGSLLGETYEPGNMFGILVRLGGIHPEAADQVRVVLGFVLVVAFSRIFRFRRGGAAIIASAIFGLTAASYLGTWSGTCPVLWSRPVVMDSVQPVLSGQGVWGANVTQYQNGMTRTRRSLQAMIDTKGQGEGVFVKWRSDFQSGETVPGRFFPGPRTSEMRAALHQVLPAPLIDRNDSWDVVDFGPEEVDRPPADVGLTGGVFRYRIVADLPLGRNRVATTLDDIATAARYVENKEGEPLAEVSLKCPQSLTGGSDSYFSYVLYLPESGRCTGLEQRYRGEGFSPGGIAWYQLLMEATDTGEFKPRSWKNARLLVIQPEFLGTVSRRLMLPPPSEPPVPNGEDWMLSGAYRQQHEAYYSNLRPHRPDPATCTEKELSRYLRSLIALFPSGIIARDLAEYAPRFPRLLALYAQEYYIGDAIENGVPESSKAEVVSAVDGPVQAMKLVRTLMKRNWEDPVRSQFLNCLEAPFLISDSSGVFSMVSAIARQEDPATYPALIRAYETTGDPRLYNVIRSLPGIAPDLDGAVDRISQRLSPVSNLRGQPVRFVGALDEFLRPVSHGNPVALAKLLQVCQNPELKIYLPGTELQEVVSPSPVPKDQQAWRDFFRGKTAGDFTYDAFARCWHPISKTH